MVNIGKTLTKAYEILKESKIDTYMLDSQLLLCKVLHVDKLFLMMNRDSDVDEKLEEEFFKYVYMRKGKMPIKYILNECEFMGINFYVKEGVLIPRPDTEILVEEVLEVVKKNNYKVICDVCCGSGAIGLSLACFLPEVSVICSDISPVAKEVTEENIKRLGLEDRVTFIRSDLLEFAMKNNEKFDVVVSNPPYIEEEIIPTLMEDVKNYEPYIALCGGKDGLDFYRKITMQSVKIMNKNGIIAFEIGYNQKEKVTEILLNNSYNEVRCINDLQGLNRAIAAKISL